MIIPQGEQFLRGKRPELTPVQLLLFFFTFIYGRVWAYINMCVCVRAHGFYLIWACTTLQSISYERFPDADLSKNNAKVMMIIMIDNTKARP